MAKKHPASPRPPARPAAPGALASGDDLLVRSCTLGALPVLEHFFQRLQLRPLLLEFLPRRRSQPDGATADLLLALVRNLLLSREPLYAVSEWAQRHDPEALGLPAGFRFDDDRLGRALDTFFAAPQAAFLLECVRRASEEFELRLDQLHNDSTTVTVHGDYADAQSERMVAGRRTPAITYGYNKDHRPDLKQLLYILTVTEDGGVPVHVQVASGNTADDRTHRQTWDLLRQLVGSADFLYVADCKLASNENLQYIARQGGRFVSVWPATRSEDGAFRQRLFEHPEAISWRWLYEVRDEHDEERIRDTFWACEQEELTADGWRLHWYRSRAKQEHDEQQRTRKTQRAINELQELQRRLTGERPRLREAPAVQREVDRILEHYGCAEWLQVRVQRYEEEVHRQVGPGRPGPNTVYRRDVLRSCQLTWELDARVMARLRTSDGVFPLVTNWSAADALQVLRTYKQQPRIEKRFSQFKTDFCVAPVYLKKVTRIQALLVCYFLALLVQALIERELRRAMEREGLESLPLYAEGRACRRPTAVYVFELFAEQQRHVVQVRDPSTCEVRQQAATTNLSRLQRQVLKLLGVSPAVYGQ